MTRQERARQVLAIRTLTAAQMEDLVPVVADLILAVERETLERAAKVADAGSAKCLEWVKCPHECGHGECSEQRSMAKACRGVAAGIRKLEVR